jgi:hypothetical protein
MFDCSIGGLITCGMAVAIGFAMLYIPPRGKFINYLGLIIAVGGAILSPWYLFMLLGSLHRMSDIIGVVFIVSGIVFLWRKRIDHP